MTVVSSNYERRANDLYETEAWATKAAIRALRRFHYVFDGCFIWEAAAGNHAMTDVISAAGYRTWSSDITTYDRHHDHIFDFLGDGDDYEVVDGIFTNPPYGKGNREAVRFAEKALERTTGFVCLLLTAKFDSGKTRAHLFRDNPRFRAKVTLLDRISWAGNGQTGTEDHAWYIWGPRTGIPHPPVILYEANADNGPGASGEVAA